MGILSEEYIIVGGGGEDELFFKIYNILCWKETRG